MNSTEYLERWECRECRTRRFDPATYASRDLALVEPAPQDRPCKKCERETSHEREGIGEMIQESGEAPNKHLVYRDLRLASSIETRGPLVPVRGNPLCRCPPGQFEIKPGAVSEFLLNNSGAHHRANVCPMYVPIQRR